MKVRICLVAAALVVAAASSTRAAEGVPSNDTLAAMGLAGLNVISDHEGLDIRGMGYSGTSAYGASFAVVSIKGATAGSTNGYKASGKKVAGGSNLSFAKVEVSKGKGGHNGGGHDNGGGYGNRGGGHGGDCYDDCGHGGHGGGKPKTVSVKAIAGGSSIGFRK
jgi:hypothetical protein